ncbi:phosphoethanolamine--lipid A transferase EptA [Myroides sp. WP-1]|uniref:phosphoethanolamine--lipid A transferase EptA n=1 Tax=Myroides sp. WP-1 TaxID=2759944 RepID=UPI0015FE0093|nr:phosphoethanolamine--lipid A transferase EptA [Myroides sp. WP-1]MBB1137905.1 phosphoethanolamine--lipid A transferase EptA [Myroides sp. WP-1]
MFKNNCRTSHVALWMSIVNTVLYHLPFFNFVIQHSETGALRQLLFFFTLVLLMVVANFFAFYLFLSLSRRVGKTLLSTFFILNAISVYFIYSYGVILDESMIGNILNTNTEESSSFFSLTLVFYLVLFGILPSIVLWRISIQRETWKTFFIRSGLALGVMLSLVLLNANQLLWIDKHSKQLGGLAMPWSYSVNTALFYVHQAQKNQKEILLPNATITNEEKSIVVLVIGESARKQNFSLYGYEKNTNPLLSQTKNVYHFDANSSATYTTAGVKSILEYKDSSDLYEILPNYLYRNQVDVIWKTTNWGEPPVHISRYQSKENLRSLCEGDNCGYDEILLTNLKEDILASTQNKILVVLHTSTSHGPTYNTKYPPAFEVFTPVCTSVELSNCSSEALINAYDNTIVYTDYLLHRVIEDLKSLPQFKSTLLFVSDHGESLGEKNLYMHGLPMRIAPKEQYEIPFIVWVSDDSKKLKSNSLLSQHHVFHSVLHFLSVESPIYQEEMNIFEN